MHDSPDESFDPEVNEAIRLIRQRVSPRERAAVTRLLKNPPGRARGAPSPTKTWDSTEEFVADLFQWMVELPEESLPPRQKDFVRWCGRTGKTVGRWCDKAGWPAWEDAVAAFMIAHRSNNQ